MPLARRTHAGTRLRYGPHPDRAVAFRHRCNRCGPFAADAQRLRADAAKIELLPAAQMDIVKPALSGRFRTILLPPPDHVRDGCASSSRAGCRNRASFSNRGGCLVFDAFVPQQVTSFADFRRDYRRPHLARRTRTAQAHHGERRRHQSHQTRATSCWRAMALSSRTFPRTKRSGRTGIRLGGIRREPAVSCCRILRLGLRSMRRSSTGALRDRAASTPGFVTRIREQARSRVHLTLDVLSRRAHPAPPSPVRCEPAKSFNEHGKSFPA